MRRRDFIITLSAGMASWPLAARAQQPDRVPRIGVLMNYFEDAPEGRERFAVFRQALQNLGWVAGHNLQIETRWAASDPNLYRQYAEELVALAPALNVASASSSVAALQRVTRSIPIVFASVADPVGAGFVKSLARPGGNTTGFTAFEYSIAGKWLNLLKDVAPNLTRVAVLRDPSLAAGIGLFAVIQSTASSSGVELTAIDNRDAGEVERALAEFSGEPNGGVINTAGSTQAGTTITSRMTRYRLPNIHPFRYYAVSGGLMSYGPHSSDAYKGAAGYVDRILKGAKPADLPVQAPTKYELVINLKTAKVLGLTVPASLLATADEVIE